jgi:hypothetical protein
MAGAYVWYKFAIEDAFGLSSFAGSKENVTSFCEECFVAVGHIFSCHVGE